MSKWEMVKLGEVCEEKIPTIKSNYDSDMYYIDISSIDNDLKEIVSYQIINGKDAPSRAKQILLLDDVLISTVRPNLNAVAINKIKNNIDVIASTGYCVLRCKNTVFPLYLFAYCKSNKFINNLVKIAKGASYPAVSNQDVRNSILPLPPLEQQRKIAKNLDLASELVTLYKSKLEQLDKLIQSVFYEMFGDYLQNPKYLKKIPEVCNFIDYRGKTPEKSENGIPLITAKNVKMNVFSFEPREYIPVGLYDRIMTRGYPNINDVLFTTEAPLGNVCRIPFIASEFAVGQRLICMQPKKEIVVAEYLEYVLTDNRFRSEMLKKSTGSTVKGIRSKELATLSVHIPPLLLQEKFADIVTKIEEEKKEENKAIVKAEMVYNSLMQEYFE